MQLGHFSISLPVKDLSASIAFYEKLGFGAIHGDRDQGWQILKNGDCVIGLFQGMFEKPMLTFNPGWDKDANTLEQYTDVRALQKGVRDQGIPLLTQADESTQGPASFVIEDPDGNPILIDQHV